MNDRELRNIRREIRRNRGVSKPTTAGNGLIKAILIGGLVVIIGFGILLATIMW